MFKCDDTVVFPISAIKLHI